MEELVLFPFRDCFLLASFSDETDFLKGVKLDS